ncbi:unnamed protein product, partial [Meganyctiphanes norvegica]
MILLNVFVLIMVGMLASGGSGMYSMNVGDQDVLKKRSIHGQEVIHKNNNHQTNEKDNYAEGTNRLNEGMHTTFSSEAKRNEDHIIQRRDLPQSLQYFLSA